MGCLTNDDGTMFVCGNFAELLPEKPKNFDYMRDAKWLEPFPKEWEKDRIRIGKTTCDCKQIETHYEPWYGFTWYHSKECALIKRVEERPGLRNLWCFENVECIGYSG